MTVDAVVFTGEGVTTHDDLQEARRAAGTTWIRAVAPTDDELASLQATFDVHPLSIEDVQNGVRPKTEEFPDHVFVLVKVARLSQGPTAFGEEIDERSLGLFVGEDWLVTYAEDELDAVAQTWARVRREEPRILQRGPDFAAYRVIDALVDEYFELLDRIEDRLERIEERVVDSPSVETLEELNGARRELLSLRKLLWPTREAVGVLARGDPPQIREATEKYYRDVYDHLVQLVDLVETYRELTIGARDIYLNALSISTNEVMKKLTVVATIILPLTFVAGVYGMNMPIPELDWPYTYHAVLAGMLGIAVVLLGYFRREGWL